MTEEKGLIEEIEVRSEHAVAKVKELVHEGNIRRISLQNEEGETLIEVPLTVGVAGAAVGTLLAPVLAAIGAIAAMAAKLKIVIEREEQAPSEIAAMDEEQMKPSGPGEAGHTTS